MARKRSIPALPPRPIDGHKGLFGRVLVVGGSDDMLGAPVLAGTAALRMGAGLVQIAVPRSILPAALSVTPELVGLGLEPAGSLSELLAAAERADAIVVGPGMGQFAHAQERLVELIKLPKPMVIDADALNMLAARGRWPDVATTAVLTPHPGEMLRLASLFGRSTVPADQSGRVVIATAAARAFGQVIVLKGHRTIVADGEKTFINRTGDSSLAKAGSGDVLAGMLGCLLAQKMDRFPAACLAVHLHGLAGERAGKALGRRSVLARDVIDAIAPILRKS